MQLFSRPAKSQTEDAWDVRLEAITPERAQHLLDNSNFDNRKMRVSTVEAYAETMRAGEWRTTPETLSISSEGRLLNGQHRLSAIIRSGVTCQFLLVRGVDETVYSVLDRGARRSVSDALQKDKETVEVATLLTRLRMNKAGNAPDFEVAATLTHIEEGYAAFARIARRKTPVFGSAPFRLAAFARGVETGSTAYPYALFKNLIDGNTEALPKAGHAAIRRVVTGTMPSSGGSGMARLCVAWPLFDPAKADTKLLRSMALETVRSEILTTLGYRNA